MKASYLTVLLSSAVVALGLASTAQADTYEFTVKCAGGAAVIEWGFGESDPGKYNARAWTNADYPDCTVRDFREYDGSLQRIRYSQQETEQREFNEVMREILASIED